MKILLSICLFGLLNIGLFSCTPEAVNGESTNPQACCGDDIDIPPPPIVGEG